MGLFYEYDSETRMSYFKKTPITVWMIYDVVRKRYVAKNQNFWLSKSGANQALQAVRAQIWQKQDCELREMRVSDVQNELFGVNIQ